MAAIIHGASRNGHNLDAYVTDVLFGVNENSDDEERAEQPKRISNIIEAVRSKFESLKLLFQKQFNFDVSDIRVMVKNLNQKKPPGTAQIKALFERLEKCRNQDNNPDSQQYKRKIQELLEDDDDRAAKLARYESSVPGINAV